MKRKQIPSVPEESRIREKQTITENTEKTGVSSRNFGGFSFLDEDPDADSYFSFADKEDEKEEEEKEDRRKVSEISRRKNRKQAAAARRAARKKDAVRSKGQVERDYDDYAEDRFDDEAETDLLAVCRPLICLAVFLTLAVFFCEFVLKIRVFGNPFRTGLLSTLLFSAAYGFVAAFVICLFKGIFGRIAGFIALFLPVFWMMIQTVYYKVFSAFFTVYSFTGAADVAEFWQSALGGVLSSWLPLILMLLPLIAYFVFGRFFRVRRRAPVGALLAVLIIGICLQIGAAVMIMYGDDDDVLSRKYLYSQTFIPELSVKEFGALTTLRLDVKNMIFGVSDSAAAAAYAEGKNSSDVPETPAEEEETVYGENVLDIDFASLAETESNGTFKDLDNFFALAEPSSKNKYTGMFEGKNLIWICAEGFSTWAINKDLTPMLYSMSRQCFVFNNYYNPLWSVSTSDGEYTVTTSLLPKSGIWSMSTSAKNNMTFCMGNQLQRKGYLCNAYHNHSYTYYNRDRSHPNLGYNFITKGHGLDITTQWPESDVEMMEKTAPDFVNSEPFHIYYMTVSGHLEYNFRGNAMSVKHKDEVAGLPYSDPCKAYIACQMELDDAVTYLVEALKQAGTLDDTLFVISGDHYPYGLSYEQIDELNGSEVEKNFELFHSTLIIWNNAMAAQDPVIVEKPCCALDVLPTVSNLMGVDFDSRLLMGRDILSDSSPLVVFNNRSWLTDKGRYNSKTGEFIPADGANVTEDYPQAIMNKVNAMFTYSAKMLESDYYAHVVPDTLFDTAPAETEEVSSDAAAAAASP